MANEHAAASAGYIADLAARAGRCAVRAGYGDGIMDAVPLVADKLHCRRILVIAPRTVHGAWLQALREAAGPGARVLSWAGRAGKYGSAACGAACSDLSNRQLYHVITPFQAQYAGNWHMVRNTAAYDLVAVDHASEYKNPKAAKTRGAFACAAASPCAILFTRDPAALALFAAKCWHVVLPAENACCGNEKEEAV